MKPDIHNPADLPINTGKYNKEVLAGFDDYELEKVTRVQERATMLAKTVSKYKSIKDFAARNGIQVRDIDLTDLFTDRGRFQEVNQEILSKIQNGRDYIGIIEAHFNNAIYEISRRLQESDVTLLAKFKVEHNPNLDGF